MGRTVAVLVDERWSCGDAAFNCAIRNHLSPSSEDDRLLVFYCRPEDVTADIRLTSPQQVQHFYLIVKPLEELHRRLSARTRWRFADKLATDHGASRWSLRVLEIQGCAVPAVVAACEEHGVDVLVVGSRGGGRLWRLLFSVAEAIQKRATCTVEVVIVEGRLKRNKENQIVPCVWVDAE